MKICIDQTTNTNINDNDDDDKDEFQVIKSEIINKPNPPSKCTRRILRSKKCNRRMTERFAPPPKIPQYVGSGINFLDSDDQNEEIDDLDDKKENADYEQSTSRSSSASSKEDFNKVKKKSSTTGRRTKSSVKEAIKPKTRSVAASKRLASLSTAHSNQLLPDSFFQEELDAVLEESNQQAENEQNRQLRTMNLRRRR